MERPSTFALRLLRDVPRAVVTAPAHWRARSWALFAMVVLAVALAYVEKRPVQSWLEAPGDAHGMWARAAAFANVAGSGWTMLALAAGTLLVGALASRRALDAATAFAVAGAIGWCLLTAGQFILAEARPSEGGAMHFFALEGHGVSGHACVAALLFSPVRDILARDLGRPLRTLVTIALIVWVVFIAWSRVWLDMHYVWNVMLGAALGFYVSVVTVKVAAQLR